MARIANARYRTLWPGGRSVNSRSIASGSTHGCATNQVGHRWLWGYCAMSAASLKYSCRGRHSHFIRVGSVPMSSRSNAWFSCVTLNAVAADACAVHHPLHTLYLIACISSAELFCGVGGAYGTIPWLANSSAIPIGHILVDTVRQRNGAEGVQTVLSVDTQFWGGNATAPGNAPTYRLRFLRLSVSISTLPELRNFGIQRVEP